MAESSVDSYINAQPEQAMSFEDFWRESGRFGSDNPSNSVFNRFFNFFGGEVDSAKSDYEAYLNNLNNRNEFLATQSARDWDKMMDDSKIQRAINDYEKAGLNPYLLINSGSIASGSAPTSSKASYKADHNTEAKKQADKVRGLALLLIAAAKLFA